VYSNGAVVSPNGVGYDFLIGTEYLLTLAGTGIDENSNVGIGNKSGGPGVSMSWNATRWETLVDGFGLNPGSQTLEATIAGNIISTIVMNWTESNAPVS
jgi:hypothetical protein